MLNMPLSDLPKFLNLDICKEVYDYSLNDVNIFFQEIIDYSLISDTKTRNEIKERAQLLGFEENDNQFNIIKYCDYYCERDISVLKQAMEKFAEIINVNLGNLNIFDSLTISSLAEKYMTQEGVFDNVYELGGIARMFIQKCVVGGRVMCWNNKKNIVEECIDDFDAVSLYPSAMARLTGLPTGKPHKLS